MREIDMRSWKRRRFFPLRRTWGVLWLAGWIVLLYLVAAPWRALGGIVDERLRWLEWFVLVTGLSVGFTTGRFARDAALRASWWNHARLIRFVLYPPAVLTAVAMIGLTLIGERGPIGVVFTGFLAHWAGLDLAYGALPLMEGQSYRFRRALVPDPGWETASSEAEHITREVVLTRR